jgi:hypothetical protein
LKQEEKSFPRELREKAVRSPGGEWGWKLEDIPEVVKQSRKRNFGILGGQIQFRLPDGTCELYDLNADPKDKSDVETWKEYSKRSCEEFVAFFNALTNKTDFEKLGIERYEYLREKKDAGINIMDHMYFMVYPVSELTYFDRRYYDLVIPAKLPNSNPNSTMPLTWQSAKLKHQAYYRGWIKWSFKQFLKSFFQP